MIDLDYILKQYPGAKVFDDGFEVGEAKYGGGAGLVLPIIQKKKWGGEAWLIYTDKYALKILFVSQGNRLSLQKHKQKVETWSVLKGHPEITLGDKKFTAEPGQIIHLPAGTIHRLAATDDDIEVLEVSTAELWDLERIEDDYGREQYSGKIL
ncbi:MAG: cupin domain-containing protein [Candidatus Doudnabacteria bacterium]|nr:cupin domain-containing protein [Candidatus Doudnabacteria bacterium]